jgi:hypothetical protein
MLKTSGLILQISEGIGLSTVVVVVVVVVEGLKITLPLRSYR